MVVDRDGLVIGWNSAARRLFGWTEEEVVGRPVDLVTGTQHRDALSHVVQEAARRRTLERVAFTWSARDGHSFQTSVCVTPVIDDDDSVIATVVYAREEAGDSAIATAARLDAERFRRIYSARLIGVCYGEHDRIVGGNETFLHAIGAGLDDLREGLALGAVFVSDPPNAEPFVSGVGRYYEIRRLDGASSHGFAGGISLGDAGWLGITVDLTERRAAERAVAHLALHDPVTGVPNRRLLADRMQQALTRASRRGRLVAALFCDVDHFKEINDAHGHRVGDSILQAVARRLESVLRGDDTVARVGGDEFVVVLQELSDPTEATRVAERARLAIQEAIPLGDGSDAELRATVSIGVSFSSGLDDDVESILRRADEAMYVAKQRGRDQVAFADDAGFALGATERSELPER